VNHGDGRATLPYRAAHHPTNSQVDGAHACGDEATLRQAL